MGKNSLSEGSCRGGHFGAEPKKDFEFSFKIIKARREIAAAGNNSVLPLKLTACHPRQSAR